jgi:hypothetical protein
MGLGSSFKILNKMSEHAKAYANGEVGYNSGTAEVVQVITADKTLTKDDSGKTFLVGTDALTITLPATIAGFHVTFINSGAAGNNIITISPQAADGIAGTITLAASVVTRVGTVDTDLVNTKATSTKGNAVSLVGTGVTGTGAWYITGSTGIWA